MSAKNNQPWEEKLQEQMEKIEKKVEDIGKRLDVEGERLTKDVEKKTRNISSKLSKHKPKHSFIWGIIFICLGLLWLGESLHWFYDLPLIPIIIIIIGILLIVKDSQEGDTTGKETRE